MASARIGMIVPFDMALDRELWDLTPAPASLHVTRLDIVDLPYGSDHARRVADPAGLRAATRTLVAIEPAVVAFGCTSASFVDGLAAERRVRTAITDAGARAATTPSGALLEALRTLGVTRVGVGTPYGRELGDRLGHFLREGGIAPTSLEHLEYTDEEEVIGAGPAIVRELAARAMRDDTEAVFLACTNLPTVPLLDTLSDELGVPVLSANQVLMWDALRLAGIATQLPGAGRRTGALEDPA